MEFSEGEDELFRDLFKVQAPEDELDGATVLACKRQGIEVEELLKSTDLEGLQMEAAENRRKTKKCLIEREREKLLLQLYHKTRTRVKLARVLGVSADVKAALPQETEDELLQREKEIEKFREKSMRQVMGLRKAEVARRQLQENIKRREKIREQVEAKKKIAYQKASREKQKKRLERLFRVRRQTEMMYLQGKVKLELKEQSRKESEMNYIKQQTIERENKSAAILESTEMVKKKAAQAHAMHEEKIRCVKDEISERLELHTERKQNVVLNQVKRREVMHMNRLRKSVAVSNMIEQQAMQLEESKATLARTHEDDDLRISQNRTETQELAADKLRQSSEKAEKVWSKRLKLNELKEERNRELVTRSVLKEQYLRRLAQDREEEAGHRREKKRLKEETMKENKIRLEKKNENDSMMQRIKIEMDIKYKAAMDERHRQERVLKERRNQETELEKRRVEEDIKRMRKTEIDVNLPVPVPRIEHLNEDKPVKNEPQQELNQSPFKKLFKEISSGNHMSLRPSTSPTPVPYTAEATTFAIYTRPFQR